MPVVYELSDDEEQLGKCTEVDETRNRCDRHMDRSTVGREGAHGHPCNDDEETTEEENTSALRANQKRARPVDRRRASSVHQTFDIGREDGQKEKRPRDTGASQFPSPVTQHKADSAGTIRRLENSNLVSSKHTRTDYGIDTEQDDAEEYDRDITYEQETDFSDIRGLGETHSDTLPATKKIPFMVYMQRYDTGPINAGDKNVIRTHGTMGLTYFYSVKWENDKELKDKFYEAVFKNSEPVCLDEKLSSPLFIMFFDWDFKEYSEVDYAHFVPYMCEAAKTVSTFWPELSASSRVDVIDPAQVRIDNEDCEWEGCGEGFGKLRSLVGSSGIKKGKDKEGTIVYSVGFHQIWIGRLTVDSQKALLMRQQVIYDLTRKFGIREVKNNSWDVVVDGGVFKGMGGFRMMGSCKVAMCDNCDGTGKSSCNEREKRKEAKNTPQDISTLPDINTRKQENNDIRILDSKTRKLDQKMKGRIPGGTCHECLGHAKVLRPNCYIPLYILDGHGKRDRTVEWILHNPRHLISACSIRTRIVELEETFVCPPGLELESSTGKKKKVYTESDKLITKPGQGYSPSSPEAVAVLNVVREICDNYTTLITSKLIKRGVTMFRLDVTGANSKWCEKSSGYHKNNIFFRITPKGISQECYSNNEECDITSDIYPIDDSLRFLLFGFSEDPQSRKSYTADSILKYTDKYGFDPTGRHEKNIMLYTALVSIIEAREEKLYPQKRREEAKKSLSQRTAKPVIPPDYMKFKSYLKEKRTSAGGAAGDDD